MNTIVLHPHSFIAFLEYSQEDSTLFLIMRKEGKKYQIKGFTGEEFKKIEQAQNKGSYIAHNILKNPAHNIEFLGNVSLMCTVNNRNYQRFLSR